MIKSHRTCIRKTVPLQFVKKKSDKIHVQIRTSKIGEEKERTEISNQTGKLYELKVSYKTGNDMYRWIHSHLLVVFWMRKRKFNRFFDLLNLLI